MTAAARKPALGEDGPVPTPGALAGDFTEEVLRRAGLRRGMRVLDVGCGSGDLTLLASWLVGPSGFVLGVDRSAQSLALAECRAAAAGRSERIRFTTADLEQFAPDDRFDAIIGREILMYLADPAAVLRRLAIRLVPGGILAFHETSLPPFRCHPGGEIFARCRSWIIGALQCAGCDVRMGDKLFATFTAAGLPAPRMTAAGRVEGGPDSPVYACIAETLRSLLPTIERAGIATAAEVDVDTLAERLRRESLANDACMMLPPVIGAWTRVPG